MSMKERNARFTIKMLNKVFIEGDEQFEKELKKEILIHDVKEHRKEVLGRLKNTEKQYKDLKKQQKGDIIFMLMVILFCSVKRGVVFSVSAGL